MISGQRKTKAVTCREVSKYYFDRKLLIHTIMKGRAEIRRRYAKHLRVGIMISLKSINACRFFMITRRTL